MLPEGLERVWSGPIMVRERDEALLRGEARRILGLPPDGAVLYVSFGGGGDAEMDAALDASTTALEARPDLHLAVAAAPLHRGHIARSTRVTPVSYYPMAELYAAFDAALSAAGYNTAMELLHHGVPSAFVPFTRQVDDQEARARAIDAAGAGICLPALTGDTLLPAVDRLLDPSVAGAMRLAAEAMAPGGGADRAAEAIVRLLG